MAMNSRLALRSSLSVGTWDAGIDRGMIRLYNVISKDTFWSTGPLEFFFEVVCSIKKIGSLKRYLSKSFDPSPSSQKRDVHGSYDRT